MWCVVVRIVEQVIRPWHVRLALKVDEIIEHVLAGIPCFVAGWGDYKDVSCLDLISCLEEEADVTAGKAYNLRDRSGIIPGNPLDNAWS